MDRIRMDSNNEETDDDRNTAISNSINVRSISNSSVDSSVDSGVGNNNNNSETNTSNPHPDDDDTDTDTLELHTDYGVVYVIDNALNEHDLRSIDTFRESLPLDNKRPTVDRRFFADAVQHPGVQQSTRPSICRLLEDALIKKIGPYHRRRGYTTTTTTSVSSSSSASATTTHHNIPHSPSLLQSYHILRYQRFLEYRTNQQQMAPHTDGTKVCCDSPPTQSPIRSTHTLLLYLTTSPAPTPTPTSTHITNTRAKSDDDDDDDGDDGGGGATLLLQRCCWHAPILQRVQPQRGRMVLFPHATPHGGAPIRNNFIKICLRAEVAVTTTCTTPTEPVELAS